MKESKQLSDATIGQIVSVALFYDAIQALLQLIPFLGQILASLIAIFAFLTFCVWFKLHGIKFVTPKRAGSLGGGFFIELIPVLNALPAWTLAVTIIILDMKAEKIVREVTKSGENKKAAQEKAV